MNFPRREELLETFEDVAELYDRARSRYPQDLFDDVFEITGLVPPARLLEIGSGTGIATAVIAERGFGVVGIELGESMAYVARQNLEGSPTVEIITGTFETYEPGGTFDAVVAFSAFHWIDPDVRYQKAASLIRESGFLVVADARLVPGDADRFFLEVDEDYEIALGERANEEGAPGLTSLRDEMEESGLFRHVAERRYRWHVTYTDTSYVELLDSFPWYRALDPSQRADLYARIRQRIQKRPTQTVTATFDAVLDVARRTMADVTRRGGTLAASRVPSRAE